ncbi:hypothetical protein ACQCVP_10725 [Rossellomorea vietnamensis]
MGTDPQALQLDESIAEAPLSARQANVTYRKKTGFPFQALGLDVNNMAVSYPKR